MWLDTETTMLIFENVFVGCLSVLTMTGTIYLCVKIIEKLNIKIKKKDNKKAEEAKVINRKKLKSAKKAIRKMLKNEYGLIPTCNQPKETEKEVEA